MENRSRLPEVGEKTIYETFYTFEQVVALCRVDRWEWNNPDWLQEARTKWLELVVRWNKNVNDEKFRSLSQDSVIGFAAISLLYAALPYSDLSPDSKDVSKFLAMMVNRIYFYESGLTETLDIFVHTEDLTGGPMYPPAYRQWIEQLYEKASWWLCYLIFERDLRADKESMVPNDLRGVAEWNK